MSLKRKRRVYSNGCPNPLFVKWVEEWRDDARERGVSSHYSYTKVSQHVKGLATQDYIVTILSRFE